MVTFQFVPYHDIEDMGSAMRVNKLLNIVKRNKIVLLEGRLKKQEQIDRRFKGIELSVVYPDKDKYEGLKKMKASVVNMLLGDRQGMTIIGPANVVKKIEQNPNKIELFTKETRKRKNG